MEMLERPFQMVAWTIQKTHMQDGRADLRAFWKKLARSWVSEEKSSAYRKADLLLWEPVRTHGDQKQYVQRQFCSTTGPLGQTATEGSQGKSLFPKSTGWRKSGPDFTPTPSLSTDLQIGRNLHNPSSCHRPKYCIRTHGPLWKCHRYQKLRENL